MTTKALDNIAPTGNGTDNTLTGVATLDVTQRRAPLGRGFNGNWIRVKPVGAAVRWLLQIVPQGAAVPTAANMIDNATATPADPPTFGPKIGEHVADGFEVERECPTVKEGDVLYIAWQGLAAGTFLQIEKGSGRPFSVVEP